MLKEEIEEAKRSVSTDTVQITIGEVSNMYTSKELNILPDFQRLFRWTNERKSNFVESILIGIPIPPVFVYENEDGTWELIDGLQRISTLLEFMGVLKDVDTGDVRRSRLQKTKYLPSMQGLVWEEKADGEVAIDKALQTVFPQGKGRFPDPQTSKRSEDQVRSVSTTQSWRRIRERTGGQNLLYGLSQCRFHTSDQAIRSKRRFQETVSDNRRAGG